MNPASLLIVHHKSPSGESTALALRRKGYAVACAANAGEAWEILRTTPVHLILLGDSLSDVEGRDFCRRVKAKTALQKVCVVLLSGARLSAKDQIAAVEAGVDSTLSRPISSTVLCAHIVALLRVRRRELALEAKDRELEEAHTRDNLVHMVVHDLRAPLTALISSLEFFRAGTSKKLDPMENACLANAASGAARLSEMIDTLLDINRLEATEMPLSVAREDLEFLTRSVAATLAPLLGRRHITWKMPRTPLRVVCDAAIVRRILTNLLDNAIRHARPDGEIILRIQSEAAGAFLSVTDDGPGIAPEFHEKIFEKFAQHGTQGKKTTGLGLTFCKLAVEAHGGRIGVTSEPGHGCTFWFTLPDAPSAAARKPGMPAPRALQTK